MGQPLLGSYPRAAGKVKVSASGPAMDPWPEMRCLGAMIFDLILFIGGLTIAAVTLRDVFETVVVPGGNRGSLRVAHRLASLLLPIWKLVRGKRRGLSGTFAPIVLVISFVLWISLLSLGSGLMIYAARAHFLPQPHSIAEAIYQAGCAIVTLGLNEMRATGLGRWIVLGAGFCGLAVMTMAVTYLLAVQSSLATRDTGVIKLNTGAGDPPSALALLEHYAEIDDRAELAEMLREGRNWCASMHQSHLAHPSLLYFQSTGTGAGWPAALGALIDFALVVESCLDEEELRGPAILLGAESTRLAEHICETVGIRPKPAGSNRSDVEQLITRLKKAGYGIRDQVDLSDFAKRRDLLQSPVEGIAVYLGRPSAPLVAGDLIRRPA